MIRGNNYDEWRGVLSGVAMLGSWKLFFSGGGEGVDQRVTASPRRVCIIGQLCAFEYTDYCLLTIFMGIINT